jgi:hypothetical protein
VVGLKRTEQELASTEGSAGTLKHREAITRPCVGYPLTASCQPVGSKNPRQGCMHASCISTSSEVHQAAVAALAERCGSAAVDG